MANKQKSLFLADLRPIKFVIGNGFDLHCGLKTKYSDFFNSDYFQKSALDYYFNNVNIRSHNDFISNKRTLEAACDREAFRRLHELNECQLTFWDFFFYHATVGEANKLDQDYSWCDIEQVLYDFFMRGILGGKPLFEYLYSLFDFDLSDEITNDRILALYLAIIFRLQKLEIHKIEDFALFLLHELKLFEKRFGEYIQNQCDFEYTNNIRLFVDSTFVDFNHLSSVDSFNFGIVKTPHIFSELHHINGNSESPIFGIDSMNIVPSDIRYIFTKTSRRMDLDLRSSNIHSKAPFAHVVVYGHSLTESDYSYFFPILDQLEINDFSKSGLFVYLYSIYDSSLKEEIITNSNKTIVKLFSEYAKYKGYSDPDRFVDYLSTAGRLLVLIV